MKKTDASNWENTIEDDNSEASLADPFNPDDISIDTKVMTMETCLRRLIQGTIKLSPDFQRNEVWTPEKKSQLIESLMLKIPLPMFYVSADEKGNYAVIDGLQRLSTIRDYVLGKIYLETKDESQKGFGFKLQNMEFRTEYDGFRYNELPIQMKNRILETEFSFTIINPGTPEEVKRNIFKRINTGGEPLSSHEIRNALYIGQATDLLNELTAMEVFSQAIGSSPKKPIKSLRMEDKELVLRYLSFYVRDYTYYPKNINVDTWLSDTMMLINSMPDLNSRYLTKRINKGHIVLDQINKATIATIKHDFSIAMTRSFLLFGKHTFRKSKDPETRLKPINKSLFEMWGVLLAQLTDAEFGCLLQNKAHLLAEYAYLLDDAEFGVQLSRDSMKSGTVTKRFDHIKNVINKHIC